MQKVKNTALSSWERQGCVQILSQTKRLQQKEHPGSLGRRNYRLERCVGPGPREDNSRSRIASAAYRKAS